jgi:hypothetical protein
MGRGFDTFLPPPLYRNAALMKRILLLVTVASMLAAAMALSGVARAGPVGSKADAQCMTLANKTLGSSFKPSNYTFIGGTAGSDTFTGTAGQSEVFCGFGGNDSIGTLQAGDIFLGGDGLDTVTTNSGTFYGGADNDTVDSNNGIFYGEAGDDSVTNNDGYDNYGGTFNGGDGNDSVGTNDGGTLVDVP